MIWAVIIAAIAGAVIGYCLAIGDQEDCPRRVLQYNCRGDRCDHRKSELYRNMGTMAQNEEERENDPSQNLRGGYGH